MYYIDLEYILCFVVVAGNERQQQPVIGVSALGSALHWSE